MSIDEFRNALRLLIDDSMPIPAEEVLEELESACDSLRDDIARRAERS